MPTPSSPKHGEFIDIHVISEVAETIHRVSGTAHWLTPKGEIGKLVEVGEAINRGNIIFLEPGGLVEYDHGRIEGGKRGRSHSFVDPDSLRNSPSRRDVPRLLMDIKELEESVNKKSEEDPVRAQSQLETEFDVVCARDFALHNLDPVAARSVSEIKARGLDAICLFWAGESVHVATVDITLSRLKTLVEALDYPVKPHLVDRETLNLLISRVYGPEG